LNTTPQLLQSHPVFENLPENTLEQIASISVQRSYTENDVIVHIGDVWPILFLVLDGCVNVIKESAMGRTLIATTLETSDLFWGLAFFQPNTPMPVLLEAVTDSELIRWNSKELGPYIRAYGEVSWKLCELMVSRMQMASEIVEDLAFQPVMGRLAGLLLQDFSDTRNRAVARDLTLEEMAGRIGSTKEMVCRYLYKFAEIGAIEINRTAIKIADRDYLLQKSGKNLSS